MAAPEDRVQGARIPAERGVLRIRRSKRGMKRNAEIGLPVALPTWRRPKAEFKARESPPSEAYSAYAAASAG